MDLKKHKRPAQPQLCTLTFQFIILCYHFEDDDDDWTLNIWQWPTGWLWELHNYSHQLKTLIAVCVCGEKNGKMKTDPLKKALHCCQKKVFKIK